MAALSHHLRELVEGFDEGWIVSSTCVIHGLTEVPSELRISEAINCSRNSCFNLVESVADLGVGLDLFDPILLHFVPGIVRCICGLGCVLSIEINQLLTLFLRQAH